MMVLRRAASMMLALAASACAAPPPDAARLQGAWRAVAAERSGAPAPELVGHELILSGQRFRITDAGRLLYGGSYTIDPGARPARIDFQQTEGAALRGTWRGICRFADAGREIVDNAPDRARPRPTEFAAGPGQVLLRFEPR